MFFLIPLTGPIILIILIALALEKAPPPLPVKVCPKCTETVPAAAEICRCCHHDLTHVPTLLLSTDTRAAWRQVARWILLLGGGLLLLLLLLSSLPEVFTTMFAYSIILAPPAALFFLAGGFSSTSNLDGRAKIARYFAQTLSIILLCLFLTGILLSTSH
jgi:hypothetical protein